tara:strand:+ start:4986 stop:5837 length:852 start_codon:yes stop_codon:yes gene_type:complete
VNSIKKIIYNIIKEPLGLIGLILVFSIIILSIGADLFAPFEPSKINIRDKLQNPSILHILGTDQLGRDLFSRVLYGGRIALKVALISIFISMLIGMIIGILAAIGKKWLDNFFLFIFDTIRSFPTIMFALAIVTLFGPSLETIILIVILTQSPIYARIVRTQTLMIINSEYIQAEKIMGINLIRLMIIHIVPNVIGPLFILASMDIPFVIAIEAGLSFLGMGVRPPIPSWGSILNDGYSFIDNSPWPLIAGGLPLIITTIGFTFLGERLRDLIDPKLKKNINL